LFAELETRVEQLKTSETDLKNLFYREQEARQVLELDYKELAFECDKHMELHIASDRDLVNCYKSSQKLKEDCEGLRAQLKELEEAAFPIARLLEAAGARPGHLCHGEGTFPGRTELV
jgi:chromosome segregation ATPase